MKGLDLRLYTLLNLLNESPFLGSENQEEMPYVRSGVFGCIKNIEGYLGEDSYYSLHREATGR